MRRAAPEDAWRARYLLRRLAFLIPGIRRRRFRQRTNQVLEWMGQGDHRVRLSSDAWEIDFPNPDGRWPLLPSPIRLRYSPARGIYACLIGDLAFTARSMPLFEILNEVRGYCLLGKPGPGETCVDLGAGAGAANVYLSARIRGARMVALEPDPRAASQLEAELRDNGFSNARVIRAAVAPMGGVTSLNLRAMGASRVAAGGGNGDVAVRAMALPDIIAAAGGRADYLKADIEGMETEIAEPLLGLILEGRVRVAAVASYHMVGGAPSSAALERIFSSSPGICRRTVYPRHPTTFVIRSDDEEMMGRLSAIPPIAP